MSAASVELSSLAAAAVEKSAFRQAMSRLGAAVNVITTDGECGRAGFTASAVCSVTDEPPTILVCLNRNASVYDTIKGNGVVCINVLAAGHQDISNLFGGRTSMDERFAAADWSNGVTGSPVLGDSVVSFDCEVVNHTAVGTHDVLFCEVRAIHQAGVEKALMYYGRRYHELHVAHEE